MADPLGLDEQTRAMSEVNAWAEDVVSGRVYERNRQMVLDLPDDQLVQITVYGVEYPPMTKQDFLDRWF